MKFRQISVDLDRIDLYDRYFVVTAGRDAENIRVAIEKTGLINPPYLVLSGSKYRIVSGFLRLRAVTDMGWKGVTANIIDPSTDEKEIFLFAFYDNLAHRFFNTVEKANIVERLLNYFNSEEITEKYLPLMGLNPSRKILCNIMSMTDLEDEIKDAVLKGVVTEKNAGKLSFFSSSERLEMVRLFNRVNLSSSKQSEIIESCRDISIRDGVSVTDIISDCIAKPLLKEDGLTLTQKGDRIRQAIREKRFPSLCRRQKQFQALKKRLQLPPGINIEPPPFFEGDQYRMTISFRTAEELNDAVNRIKPMLAGRAVREMCGDG